jgi:hypothetical protein
MNWTCKTHTAPHCAVPLFLHVLLSVSLRENARCALNGDLSGVDQASGKNGS